MTDEEYFERTIQNAERLSDDSQVLIDHARSKSAIILAVFAIEELGKALVVQWGVRNKASKRPHPTHTEKQAATFALLSADEILKKDRKRMIKPLERGTLDFLKIGPNSHQFAWARRGFYDDMRMAATYADKDPKISIELADQFDKQLATEVLAHFHSAVQLTSNTEAMSLAADLYLNGLGTL